MKPLAFFFALALAGVTIYFGSDWMARRIGEEAGKSAAREIQKSFAHPDPQEEKRLRDELDQIEKEQDEFLNRALSGVK